MKTNLLSESFTRRVYVTTDPVEVVKKDEYFNPFKKRLSVNDTIVVELMKDDELIRRHQLIITQIDPFVSTADYLDFDARIDALEEAVAELTRAHVA